MFSLVSNMGFWTREIKSNCFVSQKLAFQAQIILGEFTTLLIFIWCEVKWKSVNILYLQSYQCCTDPLYLEYLTSQDPNSALTEVNKDQSLAESCARRVHACLFSLFDLGDCGQCKWSINQLNRNNTFMLLQYFLELLGLKHLMLLQFSPVYIFL